MRPRVSPDTTVCVLLEADDVGDVAAAEAELPETDRFWPGLMRLEDSPFDCMRPDTVTLSCWAAISDRLSPRSTVWSAYAGATPATVTPANVAKLATPTFIDRM